MTIYCHGYANFAMCPYVCEWVSEFSIHRVAHATKKGPTNLCAKKMFVSKIDIKNIKNIIYSGNFGENTFLVQNISEKQSLNVTENWPWQGGFLEIIQQGKISLAGPTNLTEL